MGKDPCLLRHKLRLHSMQFEALFFVFCVRSMEQMENDPILDS